MSIVHQITTRSNDDKWATPRDLFNQLDNEFHFDFDPCPIDWNPTYPDGLLIEWKESNFVNPPYSKTKYWIKKSYDEQHKGKLIVMFINVCTDVEAFHEYIYNKPNVEVRFIKGRLRFTNPNRPECKSKNMKGSMLVIFYPCIII